MSTENVWIQKARKAKLRHVLSRIPFLSPGNALRMYTPVGDTFDRYLLYLAKPYVTFRVRACESASVTLMPDPQGTWWIDGYQIVLGSYANTKSEIRPGYNSTGKRFHT